MRRPGRLDFTLSQRLAWKPKLQRRQAQSAFTLIELLVVIAIISLLVSMLVPSLTEAKRLAIATLCSTRMRTLGFARFTYHEEYVSEHFPIYQTPDCYNPWNSWNDYTCWWDALGMFSGGEEFPTNRNARAATAELQTGWRKAVQSLFCPEDPYGTIEQAGNSWYHHSSYGIPPNVTATYRGLGIWSYTPPLWDFGALGVPAEQVFLAETHNYYSAWSVHEPCLSSTEPSQSDSIGRKAWGHPSWTLNFLFFDGHVERLKKPPHPLSSYSNRAYFLMDGTIIETGGGHQEYLDRFHRGERPFK